MKQKTIEINIKKYSEFASPNKKGILKKTGEKAILKKS
jgi:hypothetical protein